MQAIDVEDVCYAVRPHFYAKRRPLLKNVSLQVPTGEVFGFLGPNGAGKTTTIKVLLGLLRADTGQVRLHGVPCHLPRARSRVGFLPERAFYPHHLTAYEFVLGHALLAGLGAADARTRAKAVLAQTGVAHAASRRLGTFSKGMLQRTGLAQAIVGDPDIVILDEPMSGLDPLGRRDVRHIMQGLRTAGKTVFFSTHILPDVELICDRVGILVQGQLRQVGPLAALIKDHIKTWEVTLAPCSQQALTAFLSLSQTHQAHATGHTFEVPSHAAANALIDAARAQGVMVTHMQPGHGGLEQLFVGETQHG